MIMCGIGSATRDAAPVPDGVAPPSRDRARRPARRRTPSRSADRSSLWGMSAPDADRSRARRRRLGPRPAARRRRPSDPDAAVDAMLAEAQAPRRRVRRRATPARSPSSTAPASSPRCASWRRSQELARPRRLLRDARTSRPTPPTPPRGALLQRVQEKGDRDRDRRCCSSSSSGPRSTTTRADELLATDGLDFARHHLRTARRYRPHLLTEPEEKILAEKALTGRSAWTRLFEEQTSAITVELERRRRAGLARGRARRACSRPTASVRRDAAERVTAALAARPAHARATCSTRCSPTRRSTTGCALPALAGRAATSPTRPPTSRSQALIDAVRARYELPRRWYRLKAQLLGLDQLADYDRMAAVTDEDEQVDVDARRARSCSTPTARSPTSSATLVERFFDERWIDAPVRPDKRGGAFCAYTRAVRAPVRDAQLHAPAPRRADARARARPRRPRRARRAARASSTWRRR